MEGETNQATHGLSFDLSKTRTGVCLWRDREPVTVHSITDLAKTASLGELVRTWHEGLVDLVNADHDWIAYERRMVMGGGGRHLEIHYAMVGALHARAYALQIPIFDVAVSSAKKALSGSGRADKAQMLAAARERHPHLNVANHDEADAVAVGTWVMQHATLNLD